MTHPCDLFTVFHCVCPRDLDRDLAPLVVAHPHVSEPTTVRRDTRSVTGK